MPKMAAIAIIRKKRNRCNEASPTFMNMDVENLSFAWKVEHFNLMRKSNCLLEANTFKYITLQTIRRAIECNFSLTLKENAGGKDWLGISVELKNRYHRLDGMLAFFCAKIQKVDGNYSNICETVGNSSSITIPEFIVSDDAVAYLVDGALPIALELKIMTRPFITNFTPSVSMQTSEEQCVSVNPLGVLTREFKRICPSDITLKSANGKEFNCHKAVLSVRSPYFEAYLLSKDGHTRSEMSFDDVSEETLKWITHYIYSGQVVNACGGQDVIFNFTEEAGKFQLINLLAYLDEKLDTMCNVSTANRLLILANNLQLGTAKHKLMNYIKENVASGETPEQILTLLGKNMPTE